MSRRKWRRCHYANMKLHTKYPWKDGAWYVWKDKFGNISIGRMKLDAYDHFFPKCSIKEENIVAFRKLRKYNYGG